MAAAMLDQALDIEDQIIDAVDRHAEAIWCGLIAAGLAWDVVLLKRGHRLLSDAARTPVGWAVHAVLVAHFARLLGPLDPFTYLGSRIQGRTR